MIKFSVHYSFDGKAEEALEFYTDVFGGEVKPLCATKKVRRILPTTKRLPTG